MSAPLVSVIVPTYNRLTYLTAALETVLGQTYQEWELIVVDDGSTDGTVESVRSISDPRVSVVELRHMGVVGRARNQGLERATGEYVAFLDSDDLWAKDKLRIQVSETMTSGRRWSYTRFGMIDEVGRPIGIPSGAKWVPYEGWILSKLITTEAQVGIPTVMVERKLLDDVGRFDEDPNLREDYDLSLRLAARAQVHVVDQELAWFRQHPGRSTNAVRDPYKLTARVYDKFLRNATDPSARRLAKRRRRHHRMQSLKLRMRLALGRLLG